MFIGPIGGVRHRWPRHATLATRDNGRGFADHALEWFRTYMFNRAVSVQFGDSRSTSVSLQCGVPQWFVLGPPLFILYTAQLEDVTQEHDCNLSSYTEPAICSQSSQRHRSCWNNVSAISGWMASHRPRLKPTRNRALVVLDSTQSRKVQQGFHRCLLSDHQLGFIGSQSRRGPRP